MILLALFGRINMVISCSKFSSFFLELFKLSTNLLSLLLQATYYIFLNFNSHAKFLLIILQLKNFLLLIFYFPLELFFSGVIIISLNDLSLLIELLFNIEFMLEYVNLVFQEYYLICLMNHQFFTMSSRLVKRFIM